MRLVLVTVTNRQPGWVDDGYAEYARRIRGHCTLELKEIALARRSSSMPVERAIEQEGNRVLAAVPAGAHVVELDARGAEWSTADLTQRLRSWMTVGAPVYLLVGGPDGLAQRCSDRANEHWALSRLTLPHGLVRIVVAEALYRAWSVLEGHPYHRP